MLPQNADDDNGRKDWVMTTKIDEDSGRSKKASNINGRATAGNGWEELNGKSRWNYVKKQVKEWRQM